MRLKAPKPNFFAQGSLVFTILAISFFAIGQSKAKEKNPDPDKIAFEKSALEGRWKEVFFDSGTEDWKKHWFLDGKVGKVQNDQAGMSLTAGPKFKNDAHHMVLWTHQSFKGDLKIEYEYTRLDDETRCVNILYIQATGSGKGPHLKDISKWNKLREVPAMSMYFNHMHSYHISYAAFPNNQDTTSYIRGRRYMPEAKGLKGTELKPEYFPKGLFEKGLPHKITVVKKARDIFMQVKNEKKTYYCHLKNARFPEITEGRVGLRHMFTRSARYKNFRVSENKPEH